MKLKKLEAMIVQLDKIMKSDEDVDDGPGDKLREDIGDMWHELSKKDQDYLDQFSEDLYTDWK